MVESAIVTFFVPVMSSNLRVILSVLSWLPSMVQFWEIWLSGDLLEAVEEGPFLLLKCEYLGIVFSISLAEIDALGTTLLSWNEPETDTVVMEQKSQQQPVP